MNNNFLSLNIGAEFVQILTQNRIMDPTPIQHQAIPVMFEGKDMIAQAQTGTGKTLAFLLPIMQKLNTSENYVQALIITPTRELALQITQVAKMLAQANGANILAAYGGQDVMRQKKQLKNSIHIVIGTPGRLLDHIRSKSVNFTRIKTLVIDEADQTLDMGFLRDVEQIIHSTARKRQTVLCSATMPGGIAALAQKYLISPSRICVAGKTVTLEKIKQIAVEVNDRNKIDTLFQLIDEYKPFMAIIFCRTKRRAQSLNRVLNENGYKSGELHGNLTQGKREKAMKAFRETRIQYLIATDIAARGIDVEGITHIFNYDLPGNSENYIHRIGRTGRAGQEGFAITFFTKGDRKDLSLIERGIKSKIDILAVNKPEAGDKVMRKISQEKMTSGFRNTAKKPYAQKQGGRNVSDFKKSPGERRPSPKNTGRSGDEASERKGYYSRKASGENVYHLKTNGNRRAGDSRDRKYLSPIEQEIKSKINALSSYKPKAVDAVTQEVAKEKNTANRNTSKKPYTPKPGGRGLSDFKKYSGKRKPYPKNSSSTGNEDYERKGYYSYKKTSGGNASHLESNGNSRGEDSRGSFAERKKKPENGRTRSKAPWR